MNRIRIMWGGFLLATMLKWAGATWDMAWHFRQVNDAGSPAHMINLVGNVILGLTLIWAWRSREAAEKKPLLVIGLGILIALISAPLDQIWHVINGLDLTTWSPTHLLLFSGTGVMGVGFVLLWLAQCGVPWGESVRNHTLNKTQWALLAFLLFRVFSILLFPAAFNEYAAVGAINFEQNYAIYEVDSEIDEFIHSVEDKPYDDLPHSLYPAYTIALAVLLSIFTFRVTGVKFLATHIAAFYVFTRVVSDTILGNTGWPIAAIPFQHILVTLVMDLGIVLLGMKNKLVLFSPPATMVAYLYWRYATHVYTTPLDWNTLRIVLPVVVVMSIAGIMVPTFTKWRKSI